MAKKSVIARDVKREKLINRCREARTIAKNVAYDPNASEKERAEALKKFNSYPRNASPSRLQRRCCKCGRPHAVYRKFKLCRICLRNVLMIGLVPGGRKASW